jgi:hypothetical protein
LEDEIMKRKMIKCILALIMCISLCASSVLVSFAAENENSRIAGGLDFSEKLVIRSNGKADCYSSAIVSSGYTGSLTVRLQRSTDKKTWTTIYTWTASGSGTLSIDKYRYVVSGYSYRVNATFSTYSGGNLVGTATASTPVQTY